MGDGGLEPDPAFLLCRRTPEQLPDYDWGGITPVDIEFSFGYGDNVAILSAQNNSIALDDSAELLERLQQAEPGAYDHSPLTSRADPSLGNAYYEMSPTYTKQDLREQLQQAKSVMPVEATGALDSNNNRILAIDALLQSGQ